MYSDIAIGFNRFGLGARPEDRATTDPRRQLLAEFDRFDANPPAFAAMPDGQSEYGGYVAVRKAAEASQMLLGATVGAGLSTSGQPIAPCGGATEATEPLPRGFSRSARAVLVASMCTLLGNTPYRSGAEVSDAARKLYRNAVAARTVSALTSETPFLERMCHFWSNHFCVAVDSVPVLAFAGVFERDAIRAHVMGRFEDMLLAVEHHPAMLLYLNQNISIGPNSPAALRRKARGGKALGLNENLAREILELHTLGVRTGYSQHDVTELARAITGWNMGQQDLKGTYGFVFKDRSHEPGDRMIRGTQYPAGGIEQGQAALKDLARAPATSRHIAAKLATHFAGDLPPASLVDRLSAAFEKSNGDLPTLYKVLIESEETWVPAPVKLKSPWDWLISVLRGVGAKQIADLDVSGLLLRLGQQVWRPGSPAGWDDHERAWLSPDALFRRAQIVEQLVAKAEPGLDFRHLGETLLPGSISAQTAGEIHDAPDRTSALALVTMSPEFLRR